MTFTEAAVEVLRSAGKPLHYKKITEIAIERNLLSHVGKTPETTMSSRLATMVKKDRGDAPIIKVKPGVFALRDVVEDADAESEPPQSDAPESRAEADEKDSSADSGSTGEEAAAATPELPGADVFPEEDDDDELILANLDDDSKDSKRTRKRRSRRRRDRDSDNGTNAEARQERRPSRQRSRRTPETPAARAAEAGEPVGRDLSDAIETALRSRSRQSRSLVDVAESLIESGRLSGSATTLAPTLSAAIRGDNAKRKATGRRPRFRENDGQLALLEWELPGDAVNAERDAVRAADRQRESVRRALLKRLQDLPDGALLELLAAWLNAMGIHSLRAVRADAGDFNLAGTLRRGPEETPLAISIYKGRKPVEKEAVVALRGELHAFDHARIGWVITLGKANQEAVVEGQAEGAAPCAVFDGDALAAAMEEVGIAIHRVTLPLAVLDVDLLDSLGGSQTARASQDADEGSDASGNKRRRRGRRGRRRSGRDEGAGAPTRADSDDATDDSKKSSDPSDETSEASNHSGSSAEEPEDTPEIAAKPAAEA